MRIGLLAILCVSLASPAFAQTPVQLFGRDETTGQLRPVTTDATGQVNIAGSIAVGAQPATDPHFVRCSDGAAANPCVVSATNLDVQSGGADLALEAGGNLAAAATSLGTLDNIVSGAGINITQWAGAAPAATNPIPVRIADGAAFVSLSSDATHGTTTFTEATTAGPVVGVVRNDTLDSLVNTTNEIAPLAVDSTGALWTRQPDPCSSSAKAYFPVDIVTATTTEIVNASASNYIYICSINLVTGGANNVTIVEDDTDACASPTAGIFGGVTAAEGWNFGANGGLTLGSGVGTVGRSGTVNRYICFITSAAVQLSGQVVYVLAP